LLRLLEGLGDDDQNHNSQVIQGYGFGSPKIGIGLDSCVIPLRFDGLSLVQTTDFFYPLIDDPFMMGKIACANVLSDLYAMGVVDCDNILMLLGVSSKFTEKERDTVVPLIIQGFKEAASEAGTTINGGQTVLNPWCLIGGVATSVCQNNDFIMPDGACPGDVLVLTKALGTQVACNAHQWMEQNNDKWNKIKHIISAEEVEKAYNDAILSMARLNKNAAELMRRFPCHGATDVTGFGILGHADNLAKQQQHMVTFVIHNLPCINKMAMLAKACGNLFGLLQGTSAETSGGLLIALPREQAVKYCSEMKKTEGHHAWIVGVVEEGPKLARMIDKPRVIEVETLQDGTVQTVPTITQRESSSNKLNNMASLLHQSTSELRPMRLQDSSTLQEVIVQQPQDSNEEYSN